MSYIITYRPEAELDIEETAKWYETQRVDLGFEFINLEKSVAHVF